MNFLIDNKLLDNLDNHILSNSEVFSYLNDLIDYLEINDCLISITFKQNKNKHSFATYNYFNKSINFNIDKIIQYCFRLAKIFNIKENIILFINLNILLNLYHEVHHVCQNDLIRTSDNPIINEFLKELYALNNNIMIYSDLHDLLSFERDAVAVSYENILNLCDQKYKSSSKFYLFFMGSFLEYIKYGYKKNSPIEKVYKVLFKEEFIDNIVLDDFNRVKLGYPISDDYKLNLDENLVKKYDKSLLSRK